MQICVLYTTPSLVHTMDRLFGYNSSCHVRSIPIISEKKFILTWLIGTNSFRKKKKWKKKTVSRWWPGTSTKYFRLFLVQCQTYLKTFTKISSSVFVMLGTGKTTNKDENITLAVRRSYTILLKAKGSQLPNCNRKRRLQKGRYDVSISISPYGYAIDKLTFNVRGPSYLGLTRSISWLLMPWLLTSPVHQQPWYWLCKIGGFLSYLRKGFKYMLRINVEKWHKM